MTRNRIDKKRRAPAGSDSASGPAPGNTLRARGFPRYSFLRGVAIVGVLAGVGVTGFVVWSSWRAAPPVTTPKDMQRISEELRSLIQRHVAASNGSPRDARQRATLGLVYEANEMWFEALQSFRNATELDPDEPMWPHHAAIAWLKTGDLEGATVWLRESAARFPTFAPLQHRLGTALLDAGESEEAQGAFERVIAILPRSLAGYVGFGDARLRAGDATGATDALEKAVRLDPTNKLARYLLGRAYRGLGRLEDAQRELTLGRGAKNWILPDAWSIELSKYEVGMAARQKRAAEFIKDGKPAQAVEILERVRASQPDNLNALVNLGIAYLDTGKLEKAENVLLAAEQLDQTRFEIHINLAACYRRLRRFAKALTYVERAIALSPMASQAHLTHGMILKQMQQYESAVDALKTAESFQAGNPVIAQELANVCFRLGRLDEALAHFQSLARLLPDRWEPHVGIARVYFRMGLLDEAYDAAQAGLRMAPNEPRLDALARDIVRAQDR